MFLADGARREIARLLASKVPAGVAVMAFGSRVHGRNLKQHSDLDLCLRGEGPLAEGELAGIREALAESDVRLRVDVVDWWGISEEFRSAIAPDLVPFPLPELTSV